jgi:uncharacterized protein YecA (UPF0149 family)
MKAYIQSRWNDLADEDWFNEMTEHMEDHMGNIDNEDWGESMEKHMEEHWEGLEEDGNYRYGRGCCH